MTEDELLECPFCGSNDVYRIRGDPVQRCRECGASGPWKKEYCWNSRVFPALLRKKIEDEIKYQESECGLKAEALYWVLSPNAR